MHTNAGPSVYRRNYRCTRNEMKLNALRTNGLVGDSSVACARQAEPPARATLISRLHRGGEASGSVPCKFLSSNVIVIYFAFVEHRTQAFHHLGRTRDIKNGRHRVFQMFRKHFVADETRFAAPVTLGVLHLSHGGNELEVWVLFF